MRRRAHLTVCSDCCNKKAGLVIIQANIKRFINEAIQDPDKTMDDFEKALARYIGMS